MKKIFKKYMDDKIKLDKWEMVGVLSLVIVLCGVFGWAYEVVFYYLNSGMETVYLRGANFLPWINIYAIGSLLIYLIAKLSTLFILKIQSSCDKNFNIKYNS